MPQKKSSRSRSATSSAQAESASQSPLLGKMLAVRFFSLAINRFLPLVMRSLVGPIDYVGGHCSSRFVAVIARAPPALGLSPRHQISAPIEAATAERAKRRAVAGEPPSLESSRGDAQKFCGLAFGEKLLLLIVFARW